MIDCAKYFEEKEEYEKAVQLYHKGGDIPKALDLCFKAGSQGRKAMFEMLTNIAEGLGADTSPQVSARRCLNTVRGDGSCSFRGG